MAAQFIKAMCTKTGRYFGLRIEEEGGIKRCTDFYDMSPEQAKALMAPYLKDRFRFAGV